MNRVIIQKQDSQESNIAGNEFGINYYYEI